MARLRLAAALVLVALCSAAQLASAQRAAAFQWTRYEPADGVTRPSPRSSAQMVYAPRARALVLFGGSGPSAETWLFFPQNRTWANVTTSPVYPTPRTTFTSGLYTAPDLTEHMIIAHGTRRGSQVNSEVWSFSLATLSWTQLNTSGSNPAARYGQAGGIYPGTNWYFLSHGFNTHRMSDVNAYSVANQTWHRLSRGNSEYDPKRPHPRCLVGTAMATPSRMVLYGGCMTAGFVGGPCPARDAWILDFQGGGADPNSVPSGIKWTKAPDGPSPRTRSAMATFPASMGLGQGLVLLYSGTEKEKQTITTEQQGDNDLDILDTNRNKWLLMYASGEAPRFRSSASLASSEDDQGVWMFGGGVRGGRDSNELWLLTRAPNNTSSPGATASGNPVQYGTVTMFERDEPTEWFMYIHLHGLFMGLAWGILLPMGVIMARYLRHLDPLWFKIHRAVQMTGVTLSLVGFILIFVGGATNPAFAHGIIGLIVMLLGLLQPINAYYRPHKGEKWRTHWEYLHKGSGYTAILLGLVNVSLGVFLVIGPTGLIIAWFVILGVMCVTVLGLEARLWWKRWHQPPASGKAMPPDEADGVMQVQLSGRGPTSDGK